MVTRVMENLSVYIGYDPREPIAYEVLKYSIEKHASKPVTIYPVKRCELERQGLIHRELIKHNGQFFDPVSQAPASTEFSITRFIPIVTQIRGWGIFMDCDMVFVDDIWKIFDELDGNYAVQCVKHDHRPTETVKMDNQPQTVYERKNWSSFFAFNAGHPANQNLSLKKINEWPGRFLHGFAWLEDKDIGELQTGWNWLVNVQEEPETLFNAHYTLGGAWFDDWVADESDTLWVRALWEYWEEHGLHSIE